MELLEREQFISVLGELFEKVRIECGYVVSISGEAGIGKTSLVEFFTNKFKGQANILWGSCDNLFTPRPLAPLYDIANQIDSKIINQLDSGVNRPSIFSNFFKEIQNSIPKIIVIEDMHWADESTLELLRFLGRRINKTNSLLLITYRDDEIKSDHPLKLTLSNLQSNYLKRMKLSPLSENAVNTLALKYGRTDSELYQKTGGNPLLVTEVLLNEEIETPPTIKELVTSKLNRLTSEAKLAVEMISVIPGKAEKWLIQELNLDYSLIDEAIEFGILKSEIDSIFFKHELTRMAIEESLSESKRIILNSQLLDILLEQKNIDHLLARIIHHAIKAGNREVIIKYAPRAAKQASQLGAHNQAVKHYKSALELSDQLTIDEQLALLEGTSSECFLTGQRQEAIKASEEVLKILKNYPSPEREGEIYRRLSRILWYDCQDVIGEEYLDRAIKIFENLPASRNLAMAYSNKSQTYGIREENDVSLQWGERALELAKKIGDLEIEVHALNNIGCAKMLIEDKSGEIELLRSLEVAIENEYYEHATRAYTNLGAIHLQQRNLIAADKYFAKGLEYAHEKDIYIFSLCLAGHYSKVKLYLGKWDESVDMANFVLHKENIPPGNTVMPNYVVAIIRARRDDPGVMKLINECFRLAFQMGEMEKIVSVVSAKAEYFWLQNKLADFTDELSSIYFKVLRTNNPWAIGEIAYWVWKANRLNEIPKIIAKPFRLQIEGNWQDAAKTWDELHCPYEQALALSDGDEVAMKKSLEIFESLGASATVRLIKQKMRESGIRSIPKGPRQSTKANPSGLTKRELEVLKLLSHGLSNSDIAKQLFISPKTVDHHISAVFSKLNIHSRIEAASYFQSNLVTQLSPK